MDSPSSSSLVKIQQRVRDVLTALPRLLADKLIPGNTPGDDSEEINLGKLKVITGSKYRQYCRAKYGPGYLENFTEKYLSEPHTVAGRYDLNGGPKTVRTRVYQGLLGSGNGGDQEPELYAEAEGVTTVALPPVAPVLFVFLVWRAGKHGARLFESWRSRLTRPLASESAEENRQDRDRKYGLLDFVYDRMMGFVGSEFEPTSQNSTDELSALELPFLVALPGFSSDSKELPPQDRSLEDHSVRPHPLNTNPDSPVSSLSGNRRLPLAIALELSTPDSVGLQRVLIDDHSLQSTPFGGSQHSVADAVSEVLHTSTTSAIMRGTVLNPDVLQEGETGGHTPRQVGDFLPYYGEGISVLETPPFELLLRPCSVHEYESLGTPKPKSTDHGSVLVEPKPPAEQHDCTRVDDVDVLVLLLENDTNWHEYERQLLEAQEISPAAKRSSSSNAREPERTISMASTPWDHPRIRITSPTTISKQGEVLQKTSANIAQIDGGYKKSETQNQAHEISTTAQRTRNNNLSTLYGTSRSRNDLPVHASNSPSNPWPRPNPPLTRHGHSVNTMKHTHSATSERPPATDPMAKTGFDRLGKKIIYGSQDAPLSSTTVSHPTKPFGIRARSHRSAEPDSAPLSSTATRSRLSFLPSATTQTRPDIKRRSRAHTVENTRTSSSATVVEAQPLPNVKEVFQFRQTSKISHRRRSSDHSGPPITQYPRAYTDPEPVHETRRPDSPHPQHLHGDLTRRRPSNRQRVQSDKQSPSASSYSHPRPPPPLSGAMRTG